MSGHVWHESMRRYSLQLAVLVLQRCAQCGEWVTVTATTGHADTHGRLFEQRCSGTPKGTRRYKATVFYRRKWVRPETLPEDILSQLENLKQEAQANQHSRWRILDPEEA